MYSLLSRGLRRSLRVPLGWLLTSGLVPSDQSLVSPWGSAGSLWDGRLSVFFDNSPLHALSFSFQNLSNFPVFRCSSSSCCWSALCSGAFVLLAESRSGAMERKTGVVVSVAVLLFGPAPAVGGDDGVEDFNFEPCWFQFSAFCFSSKISARAFGGEARSFPFFLQASTL